ncbi:peptidase C14 [Lophiostoma macrostomum CBS 122681]|uniref:Peptidase C14 n=1 Tax=Lophiostoma macrostomum CBS 122681 TaxID=1314788 RepID=A0A6A6T6Z2_9PLEO|nr:peptidase C14 [Lophiostoma macrostomum CBS 122681]
MAFRPPYQMQMPPRKKKSLLIGINYLGTQHQLNGCHQDIDSIADFLSYRGYTNDHRSRVILSDIPGVPFNSPYYPTGHNILAAMDWLVCEPNCTLFLHYSGHGGQIDSQDGVEDSLVPYDFEQNGQIGSRMLHEHLVTRLAPGCTLFIVLDCCHSGSAVELPFVYRSDSDGQISLMDNLKAGVQLYSEAENLIEGGFSYNKMGEARHLLAGATSFFQGIKHMGEQQEEGLQGGEFAGQYGSENKVVTMFSGCRDDQTSADARIQGRSTGAMTWAFLETMKRSPRPSYVQTLQMTRQFLDGSHYTQIPQLSCGVEMDLDNTPLML